MKYKMGVLLIGSTVPTLTALEMHRHFNRVFDLDFSFKVTPDVTT
jgi:hypothetical protein